MQGSIVSPEFNGDLARYGKSPAPEDRRLVVISQSCDVVQRSDQAEPEVELLVLQPIEKLDGAFTSGKHSRNLHLNSKLAGEVASYSTTPFHKLRLPREALLAWHPSPEEFLPDREIRAITHWLAARYVRAAFPDDFEGRLRGVPKFKEKTKKQAKKISKNVRGIYLKLYPDAELGEEEVYSVQLLALVRKGCHLEDPSVVGPIEAIVELFKQAGMDVRHAIRGEDTVPYSVVVDEYRPWNFDSISLDQDPQDALP